MEAGTRKAPSAKLFLAVDESSEANMLPYPVKADQLPRLEGFDGLAERLCRPFYAGRMGHSSPPRRVDFRIHLPGFLSGLTPERSIAW